MSSESGKVIISTGNTLGIYRKAGQKTSEELFECLKLTLTDPVINPKTGQITRNNDDLISKVTESERNNIKIGAKVFINRPCTVNLEAAIDSLLNVLQVTCLDNLILAYHPSKTGALTNGNVNGSLPNNLSTSVPKEGVLEWGNEFSLDELKRLWSVLENYAEQKKICQLGIADLDTDSLIELYNTCEVKPTIAQINLSACCVVPPSLQEFCAKNDIQLLTHSDPEEIITKHTFEEIGSELVKQLTPTWTSRYQVHIKCRGVLAAKGFIVGASHE